MLKKIVILSGIILLLQFLQACRPSNEEKARDLILHYCDIHFKHYQPGNFTKPKPYYIPYPKSQQYITYSNQRNRLTKQHDSISLLITKQNKPVYLLQADTLTKAIDSLSQVMSQYRQKCTTKPYGWMVVHNYNQKPRGGSVIHSITIFILNNDFNKILETYDK